MCSRSRKYLRHSKKIFLKGGGITLFQKKKIKKKKNAIGSKLTPHKTVSTKSCKYRVISFSSYKCMYNVSLYITTLQYVYSSWINLYYRVSVTDLGVMFLTPGIFSRELTYITSYTNFFDNRNNIGMPVLFYKVGQIVSNVKSSVNGSLASSSGTHSTVIEIKRGGLGLRLPSGVNTFKKNVEAYLGPNIVVPKLSNYRFKKTLLRVRGIAKNPVDHPNGGRSNTKGSFKTPWGKVAKFSK